MDVGSLFQPVFDFVGGAMDNFFAERSSRRDQERARELLHEQWAYNHPSKVAERLDEAGFNRALALGSGSMGGASASATPARTSRTGNMARLNIPQAQAQLMSANSQKSLNDALSRKANAEASLLEQYGPLESVSKTFLNNVLGLQAEDNASLLRVEKTLKDLEKTFQDYTFGNRIAMSDYGVRIASMEYDNLVRDARQADWEYLHKNPLVLESMIMDLRQQQENIVLTQINQELAKSGIYLNEEQTNLIKERVKFQQDENLRAADLHIPRLSQEQTKARYAGAREVVGMATDAIGSVSNLANASANVISSLYGRGTTRTIVEDVTKDITNYDAFGNVTGHKSESMSRRLSDDSSKQRE